MFLTWLAAMQSSLILLDVISDGGDEEFARRKPWYGSFGFKAFASNPARMFLVMKQARMLVHARRGLSDACYGVES